MTALANRPSSVTIHAIAPPDPTMTPTVAHAVAAYLDPVIGKGQFGRDDPGHWVAPPAVSTKTWQDAQRLAEQFDAMLTPVSREVLAAWLMPVNAASRNPQGPAEFALRVAGIAEMVGDLPAAAFTAETRRKLATGFFPSHEDVRAAVEPTSERWVRKRDALRSLRTTTPTDGPRRVIDAEERSAVATGLAALAKDLAARASANEAGDRARVTKPLPLHPHALLRAYEESGTPAGQFRAAQLRKALERADADARDA